MDLTNTEILCIRHNCELNLAMGLKDVMLKASDVLAILDMLQEADYVVKELEDKMERMYEDGLND